jgi:hypothetical protein
VKRRTGVGSAAWWKAWTRFEPTTGCVLWTGSMCPLGYARTWWRGKAGVLVHRVAYEQVYGPFDPSLNVCHRCDTPSCVNPDHLFLGTQKDNLRDMFAKGRARPHGKATAALTFPSSVAPALSSSPAAPETGKSAQVVGIVHLIRTSAIVPRWRQVTGVPSSRPTQAIQLYKRPISWTHELEARP